MAAFLVSGTGIFKKKIEENRQQDIQRQEVEKAFEQMMAAQTDRERMPGKGRPRDRMAPPTVRPRRGTGRPGLHRERTRVRGSRPRRSPGMNISGIRSLSEIPGLWGLMEYGQIQGATFFANSGMSVYHIYDKKVSVAGMGDVSFDEVLSSKQFRKIFVMLGINELGIR